MYWERILLSKGERSFKAARISLQSSRQQGEGQNQIQASDLAGLMMAQNTFQILKLHLNLVLGWSFWSSLEEVVRIYHFRCDGKGFDLTEVVRAGHRTCNQRLRQVQSTTTTTPTTIPTTTTPATTRRAVVWTTRRYRKPYRPPLSKIKKPTVRSCVWIFCWG